MTGYTSCDNCGGDGGFEANGVATWDDPYRMDWVECPTCHGSGWVEGDPEPIDQDELPTMELDVGWYESAIVETIR